MRTRPRTESCGTSIAHHDIRTDGDERRAPTAPRVSRDRTEPSGVGGAVGEGERGCRSTAAIPHRGRACPPLTKSRRPAARPFESHSGASSYATGALCPLNADVARESDEKISARRMSVRYSTNATNISTDRMMRRRFNLTDCVKGNADSAIAYHAHFTSLARNDVERNRG